MVEESTYTLAKKYESAADDDLGTSKSGNLTKFVNQSKLITPLGHILAVIGSLGAALITASGSSLPRWMESQTYGAFNYLKGQQTLPKQIVIVAIDDQSISLPEQYYNHDPIENSQLEPLASYPFKREAYAQAIDKLIDSGALHVGVDVVFDQPSGHGGEDDLRLLSTLKRHGKKVTLAAIYENSEGPQGTIQQLTKPQQMFLTDSVSVGTVNFPLEIDGKIHRLASSFNKQESDADAIATLLERKTIGSAFSSSIANGILVLFVVGGVSLIISRSKQGTSRFFYSIVFATLWGGTCFIVLIVNQLILPAAVPILAIATVGFFYLGTDFLKEIFRKGQLVDIFRKYSNNHVVREILSQQQDLKDLIEQRQIEVSGKILDFRYKIIKVLGAGGFSETYVAEDTKRPGNPLCVVKQLKPATHKSQQLKIARRLFNAEAKTLEKLGNHSQIPQLLAYFEEEEEFYLVQEYIIGHPLSHEMISGKKVDEVSVIHIMRDLLRTLAFVHANEVIHRDIKPNNIIRRNSDGQLVLIDFGAVKEVSAQQLENQEQTSFTIGIGTKGYAPNEQCFGNPQFSSDVYAVGMIAIKALTGIPPHKIEKADNGELSWVNNVSINPNLAEIITKMVLNNHQERYQSASEALIDLEELVSFLDLDTKQNLNSELSDTLSLDNYDDVTTPWLEDSQANISNSSIDDESPTSILPLDESTDESIDESTDH